VRLAAATAIKLHLSGVDHNDAVVVESGNASLDADTGILPSHDAHQQESDAGVGLGNDAFVVESSLFGDSRVSINRRLPDVLKQELPPRKVCLQEVTAITEPAAHSHCKKEKLKIRDLTVLDDVVVRTEATVISEYTAESAAHIQHKKEKCKMCDRDDPDFVDLDASQQDNVSWCHFSY